jgi:hypothetical protein
MKEIKNIPSRPKSSGAQKIHPVSNKELFNSTVPIKFFNANLDESGVRESMISSAIQGLNGEVPAKHNLLATSMRINSSQMRTNEDRQKRKPAQSAKPLSATGRPKLSTKRKVGA